MTDMGSFANRAKGEGFVPNHKEFGLHIRSKEAGAPPKLFAEEIAARANATAPVGDEARRDEFNPGQRRRRAKGSVRVKVLNVRVGQNSRRSAEAYSLSPSFIKNEFGRKGQRPKHTLLRAGIHTMRAHGIPMTELRGEDRG